MPAGPTPAPSGPLSAEQVIGFWSGDWGNLVMREQGGKIHAVYDHDDGTIVGTIVGDKLVGWWCEAPSRQPDGDAGDVEMRFITNEAGQRAIDGRWRYGTTQDWNEDWDITFSNEPAPEALVKRFADSATFCQRP